MCWVNAFLEAGNDSRQVSIGGRRANANTWARFMCDTAAGVFTMSADAAVRGTLTARSRRNHEDTRHATFGVSLPDGSECVSVHILGEGNQPSLVRDGLQPWEVRSYTADSLLRNRTSGVTLTAAAARLAELTDSLACLPEIILPGAIGLRRALACAVLVEELGIDKPFEAQPIDFSKVRRRVDPELASDI